MIYSKPQITEKSPYTSVLIDTCTDVSIVFDLLENVPQETKRRYCNKVLVHECISQPEIQGLDLESVDFMATSDPCYGIFEFYKTSLEQNGEAPSIIRHINEDTDLVESIEIAFKAEELCCKPTRLTYRLYGNIVDEPRILLSSGNLFLIPCQCCGCHVDYWTEVGW